MAVINFSRLFSLNCS